MKKWIPLSILVLSLSSCLNLDSNLFNSKAIPEYQRDAYTGPHEIDLDSSYKIPDSLIHEIMLVSDDNGDKANIYGEYLGSLDKIATDTVIMYFHGTRDNMDYYWNRAKLLANVGGKNRFGVLTIDYRGYGKSEGTPTESGMYADGAAAIQWLKDRGLTNDRFIMYGFSLGSAAATELTANPRAMSPAKLILESPFASAAVMVQDGALLGLPPSYFTSFKIDNAEEIKKVQQPFMWMHGVADDYLSIEHHGEVVYNNYQGAYKEAHRIEGAGHGDVPKVWGLDNYKKALEAFITR